jgi:hypothetical protein
MGREAATYAVLLSADDAAALARAFDAAGCEWLRADDERVDFALRDPNRYWIDLRLHLTGAPRLEIRVALTNDTWSLRAPLERALTPLPQGIAGRALLDEDGNEIAIAGADGWLLAFEDDYGRRRDEFIARIGDFNAPISADHVYMYLHQTRWNRDNDDELAWHREREIAKMEEMWETGDEEGEPGDGP